jgi:GR25 family glycosyltransferase involved in LPS biosynthesis
MKNSQRSDKLLGQLQILNLPFTEISAINGAELQRRALANKIDSIGCYARLGYKISPGLIGCFLSHQSIYKIMVKDKISWALVLEEDVSIVNIDFEILNQLMSDNGAKPTIIQLFSRSSRLIKKGTLLKHGIEKKYVSFEFHRRLVGSGAAAYLINIEAAVLASKLEKVNGAPDWPPWSVNVKFFGVFPWMFYEDDAGSTIPNNKISRYAYFSRRVLMISGIHYFIFHKKYESITAYIKEEIIPYIFYLYWKLKGSKYYSEDLNSPQIL